MTWPDASKICMQLGGFLAWINNKAEHQALQKIIKEYLSGTDTWIGLYRSNDSKNPIGRWAGGSNSLYRGDLMKHVDNKYFGMSSDSLDFKGWQYRMTDDFICRRF